MLFAASRSLPTVRLTFVRLLSAEAAPAAVATEGEEGKGDVTAVEVQKVGANEDGTFRVLEIPGTRRREYISRADFNPADGYKKRLFPSAEPRFKRMSPKSTTWTNVWPTAQTFKWSVVPLPVRQGYVKKGHGVVPGKYANAELMKIPNFFHLTPEHIRKHCQAIKQFCTAWPAELDTDAKCLKNFPIEVSTSTYCHAGPSIRHPNARKVTLRVPLSNLGPLDFHAKDKLLRLLGPRYDPASGLVTIIADKCPTSRQNYEYASYLLTAVYYESWKIEDWERKKTNADLGKYYWHLSTSRKRVVEYISHLTKSGKVPARFTDLKAGDAAAAASEVDIVRHPVVSSYKSAVADLFNNGESELALQNYRSSVERLLGLPQSKFAQ